MSLLTLTLSILSSSLLGSGGLCGA